MTALAHASVIKSVRWAVGDERGKGGGTTAHSLSKKVTLAMLRSAPHDFLSAFAEEKNKGGKKRGTTRVIGRWEDYVIPLRVRGKPMGPFRVR